MEELIALLKSKKLTIASAESLTGGLFASSLTDVPGASSVFKGSVVTYATEIKHTVLGVEQEVIDNYGVISHECAESMVKHLNPLMNVDVGISFTGNAGPEVMEGKEVGLVYIGINYLGKIEAYKFKFHGSRNEIRTKCVKQGIKLLKEKI